MGEVYISDLLSHTLPEWGPFLILSTMGDMDTPQGSRQVFEFTRTDTGQHVRYTQENYKYEDDFKCSDTEAVDATVIVIRDHDSITMMLECEETEQNS